MVNLECLVSYYKGPYKIVKALNWITASLQIYYFSNFKYKNEFQVIYSVPPISFLTIRKSAGPKVLVVFDVYPEIININFALLKSLWRRFNKKAFKISDALITISEGLKEKLSEYGLDVQRKTSVVPNWYYLSSSGYVSRKVEYKKKNNVDAKLILLYSGTVNNDVVENFLVDLLLRLEQLEYIYFILVINYQKEKRLLKKLEKKQITGLKIVPFLDRNEYVALLESVDMGISLFHSSRDKLCFPSKIYNYLSVGIPVLSFTDKQTEISDFIRQYEVGSNYYFSQIELAVRFLKEVSVDNDKLKEISKNTKKFQLNYSSEMISRFTGLIKSYSNIKVSKNIVCN